MITKYIFYLVKATKNVLMNLAQYMTELGHLSTKRL